MKSFFDELENTDVRRLTEALPDMEQDDDGIKDQALKTGLMDLTRSLRLPELQASILELKGDLERLNDSVVEMEEDFEED